VKAGLEVHQQLATGKLFCECPTELSETVRLTVVRELRATSGESLAVDPAAAFQASRGLRYRYEATPTSCLVEMDEEPPHALNAEAVDVALTLAVLLHARPLDEVQVMRKIVVDGSNTSGFQRTALVAVGGYLETGGRHVSIQSICLEEDAARKVGEATGEFTYRLDRLGIPLIEIATGPDIQSGAEAREVAEEIGALLRSTGKVRRGIGTIREDLNVSIEGGNRVEIKGAQELRLIEKYVETEEERQTMLLKVRGELVSRGAHVPDVAPVDVGDILSGALEGAAAEVLRKSGAARAIPLAGFAGLLKPPGGGTERLGRELADRARAIGLKGLIHSDELPGYGLAAPSVEALRARLKLAAHDAFVIVVAPTVERADMALRLVAERARLALVGVPGETRDPLPDGRSRYSRPLPGRDRMYPETDVPPVPVASERLEKVRAHLPETPEARRARLAAAYGLSSELIRQLESTDSVGSFETLVKKGHPSSAVARLLTQDVAEAESSVDPARRVEFSVDQLDALLAAVRDGRFAKEGNSRVLTELLRGAATIEDAATRAGVAGFSRAELKALADRVVRANARILGERGREAFSALMGEVMKEVRGRRDGREVADVLRAAIERARPPEGTQA